MGQTGYDSVSAQGLVASFWGPIVEKELRENTLWPAVLADPNYKLEDAKGGETIKITRINKPTSTIRTIGTDADSFDTNTISSTQVDLTINRRAVSAYEFSDLSILMSQLNDANSDIRDSLLADVKEQVNDHIKGLISPSSSSPDHVTTSSDFNLAQLSATRLLAAAAKWGSTGEPWYLFADPSYYSDMLDDSSLGASDVMGVGESPMVGGKFVRQRMQFNIVEDDSLSTDTAYAFIPSFMKVIMGEPRFLVSPLHAQKKFGYVISCDVLVGAVQLEDTRVISVAVS